MKIIPLKKKIIFQTSVFGFHVSSRGCIQKMLPLSLSLCWINFNNSLLHEKPLYISASCTAHGPNSLVPRFAINSQTKNFTRKTMIFIFQLFQLHFCECLTIKLSYIDHFSNLFRVWHSQQKLPFDPSYVLQFHVFTESKRCTSQPPSLQVTTVWYMEVSSSK